MYILENFEFNQICYTISGKINIPKLCIVDFSKTIMLDSSS